ncbi:hypothetical protein DY000_02014816 [Brassica cretica]|uniref:Uncharacterized protein n=1 Tax=Brassica cretica TaxID=69181 RepID=A0ABQ7CPG7_BRACR|nr:hypothetical protein DY000_02014816 [Brassica cretica]
MGLSTGSDTSRKVLLYEKLEPGNRRRETERRETSGEVERSGEAEGSGEVERSGENQRGGEALDRH